MPTTTGVATSFIDFTRASNATVTDSDGKVKWAPHNLLTNSESFDAAAWAKENTTVDANVASAPNGTSTAELLKNTTAGGVHGSYFTLAGLDASNGVRLSCFVKKNTVRYVALGMWNASGTAECGAGFDLDTVTGVAGAVGAGYSASNASITSVGSSWYLISVTVVTPVTSNYATIINRSTSYSSGRISEVYTGATSESTYIWGASLYRSDLGGMQPNTSAYPLYNPTTPKNLLGNTEDVNSWTKSNVTVSTNVAVAYNGLQTADLVYPTTTGTARQAILSASGVANTPYTTAHYVKSAGFQWVALTSPQGSSYGVYFDVINGVKGAESAGCVGSITPVGNGWFRCSITQTVTGTTIYSGAALVDANNSTTATTSGTSGIYLWGAQLSDSASLDSYVPVYGAAVTSAAYYGPRRDFDGATLACKGLLVEEQRTNQFLYSDQFDNTSYWSTTGAVTAGMANAAVAPTGTSVADALTEDTSTGVHRVYGAVTLTAATYTLSFYAKANGRNWIYIYTDGGTTAGTVNFTTNTYVPLTGTATVSSVLVGNSWYRVTYTFSNTITSSQNIQLWLATDGTTNSYTGNGTSGIYLFGAQIELGSFATSYIPAGAAVGGATRNADVASVSTQAFPYSASASSIVIALQHLTPTTASGTNHGHWILQLSGSAVVRQDRIDSSALIAFRGLSLNADTGKTVGSSVAKIGTTFSTGDVALVVNGGSAYTSASATGSQSADTLTLGRSNIASAEYLNGHIRQITYLPRRISNTELQTRTS